MEGGVQPPFSLAWRAQCDDHDGDNNDQDDEFDEHGQVSVGRGGILPWSALKELGA